jgi:hypothetical protein
MASNGPAPSNGIYLNFLYYPSYRLHHPIDNSNNFSKEQSKTTLFLMLSTLDLHEVAYRKMAAEACAPDINLRRLIAHASLLETVEEAMEQSQLDAILKARHQAISHAKLDFTSAAEGCSSLELDKTDQAIYPTSPLDISPVLKKLPISSLPQRRYLAHIKEEDFKDVSLSDQNFAGSLVIIATSEIEPEEA